MIDGRAKAPDASVHEGIALQAAPGHRKARVRPGSNAFRKSCVIEPYQYTQYRHKELPIIFKEE